MVKRASAGFTLIELIIVAAITGSLILIAFAGQGEVRSRAQFNAAVDKIVSSVADARTQAIAGVNVVGNGVGAGTCPGGSPGVTVFAGAAWTADNNLANGPIKIELYEAVPGGKTCVFDTQLVGLSDTLHVNVGNPVATQGGRILFVRGSTGGLSVCEAANLSTINPVASFQAGGCAGGAAVPAPNLTLTFSDTDGHKSQMVIDQSGLAKRLN